MPRISSLCFSWKRILKNLKNKQRKRGEMELRFQSKILILSSGMNFEIIIWLFLITKYVYNPTISVSRQNDTQIWGSFEPNFSQYLAKWTETYQRWMIFYFLLGQIFYRMNITHVFQTVLPLSEFAITIIATLQLKQSYNICQLVPSKWLAQVILTNILGSSESLEAKTSWNFFICLSMLLLRVNFISHSEHSNEESVFDCKCDLGGFTSWNRCMCLLKLFFCVNFTKHTGHSC